MRRVFPTSAEVCKLGFVGAREAETCWTLAVWDTEHWSPAAPPTVMRSGGVQVAPAAECDDRPGSGLLASAKGGHDGRVSEADAALCFDRGSNLGGAERRVVVAEDFDDAPGCPSL